MSRDSTHLALSVASIWELGLKHSIGKLSLPGSPRSYVSERCQQANIQLVSITSSHVFRVIELPLHHRDPFDRIIIAQAVEEDWTVITGDPAFEAYPVKCLS